VVKKGTVLAEIEPRVFQVEAERAKAMVTRAEAQAKVADARFDRVKAALEKGIVPKEEVDQAAAEREVTRAELMAAKAELELAELRLSWTKIVAPVDGKLSRLNLTVGNIVRADADILVSIVRTDPLFVVFDVDERFAVQLLRAVKEKKLTAAVGFATEDGFPHEAEVDDVAPVIDPQKATLRVRAKLPNPKGEHIPGQFARVRLSLPK
jgi:RND family efflux transporter MFP subunit